MRDRFVVRRSCLFSLLLVLPSGQAAIAAEGDDRGAKIIKRVYDAYKKAGIENVLLIKVPMSRRKLPEARRLMQAIDYLDSRGEQ